MEKQESGDVVKTDTQSVMEKKESDDDVKTDEQQKVDDNIQKTSISNAITSTSSEVVTITNSAVPIAATSVVVVADKVPSRGDKPIERGRDMSPSRMVTSFDSRYSVMMSGSDDSSKAVVDAEESAQSSVEQIKNNDLTESKPIEDDKALNVADELDIPAVAKDHADTQERAVAEAKPSSEIADSDSAKTVEGDIAADAAEKDREQLSSEAEPKRVSRVGDDADTVHEKRNAQESPTANMKDVETSGDDESKDLTTPQQHTPEKAEKYSNDGPKRFAGFLSEKLIAEELKSSLAKVSAEDGVRPTRIFKDSVRKHRSIIRDDNDEESIEFMEKKLRKTSTSSSSSSDGVMDDRPIVDYRVLPSVRDRIGNLGDFSCSVLFDGINVISSLKIEQI